MLKFLFLLGAMLLAPFSVFAQGSVLQAGPPTGGHAPMYSPGSGFQTVIQDSGPAGGGLPGLGLSESLQVNRSATTSTGSGPLGTHDCDYSAPISTGAYYYLCFDANAQGGGLIAYGNVGSATAEPLLLNINGVSYTLPGSGSCLGCGTMAGQNSNDVAITGGTISGTTLTNDTFGGAFSGTFDGWLVSTGATFSVSGCTPSAELGGATAGTFITGYTGGCTAVVTMGASATAPHGWSCSGSVLATTNLLVQTAYSSTSASLYGTVSPGQTVIFSCQGF